jgi:hypothetical protein
MRVLRRRPRPRAKTFRPVEGYLLAAAAAAAAAGDALRSDPNPATQLMRRSTSSRRQFQGRSSAGSGPAYPPSIRLLRRRSASTTTRSQAGLADLRSRHGNASTPPASASAHAPNVRSPSPSIRGFDSPRLHPCIELRDPAKSLQLGTHTNIARMGAARFGRRPAECRDPVSVRARAARAKTPGCESTIPPSRPQSVSLTW